MFHSQLGTRNKTVLYYQFGNNNVPFTIGNSEQNGPKLPIWELYVPFAVGKSEQNIAKLPIWEQFVPFTVGNSERNVLVLSQSERFVPNL